MQLRLKTKAAGVNSWEVRFLEDCRLLCQCHRSYQREFDPTPGGSGRQEGLACCGPWGHKEWTT